MPSCLPSLGWARASPPNAARVRRKCSRPVSVFFSFFVFSSSNLLGRDGRHHTIQWIRRGCGPEGAQDARAGDSAHAGLVRADAHCADWVLALRPPPRRCVRAARRQNRPHSLFTLQCKVCCTLRNRPRLEWRRPSPVEQRVTHLVHKLTPIFLLLQTAAFFSDIIGFTSITETTPPQVLIAALAEYFNAMTDIIHERQGLVGGKRSPHASVVCVLSVFPFVQILLGTQCLRFGTRQRRWLATHIRLAMRP